MKKLDAGVVDRYQNFAFFVYLSTLDREYGDEQVPRHMVVLDKSTHVLERARFDLLNFGAFGCRVQQRFNSLHFTFN